MSWYKQDLLFDLFFLLLLLLQKASIPRSVIQVLEAPAEARRGVVKASKGKSEKKRRQSSETAENQENTTGVS